MQSEWMVDGKLEPVEQDCVRKPLDSRSAISDHHTRYELRISRCSIKLIDACGYTRVGLVPGDVRALNMNHDVVEGSR